MMQVAVLDRFGKPESPVVREVRISRLCPQCKGPRGIPRKHMHPERGEVYNIDIWENACGHIDHYPQVLLEAFALGLEATAPA